MKPLAGSSRCLARRWRCDALARSLVVLALLASIVAPLRAARAPLAEPGGDVTPSVEQPGVEIEPEARLDPAVVRAFEALPVQDGGRIKPLLAVAEVTLLRLSGKRSTTTPQGERLSASEWMLRALLYPERAVHDEVFLVENSDVLVAAGLEPPEERRSRLSWTVLEPGLPRMLDLAHEASQREPEARKLVDTQLMDLASNAMSFARLLDPLDRQRSLALFPPEASAEAEPEWFSAADLLGRAASEGSLAAHFETPLQHWWSLRDVRADTPSLHAALRTLGEQTRAAMQARAEGSRLTMELDFRRARWLDWSQVSFLLGFLCTAALWLRGRGVWIARAAWGLTAAGVALLVVAIVLRCVIRGRPPVSTLYETVVFVTASGTLLALIMERFSQRRIGLSAAAVLGTLGVFVANGYELLDRQDTMPSLVAVLDTNFWLATHVTAITLGYSAGLLAALLGNGLLLMRLFGRRAGHPGERELGRMIYGTLAFAVIFSTVGTILGGIWANDSWGRFWGWDPKENGALLIVITQVAILHGRKAGRLRAFGTAWCAAFAGTVIAFSWWGVNLLGVGLHSYGFTDGIHGALWNYYYAQWGLCFAAGLHTWLSARGGLVAQVAKASAEGEGSRSFARRILRSLSMRHVR